MNSWNYDNRWFEEDVCENHREKQPHHRQRMAFLLKNLGKLARTIRSWILCLHWWCKNYQWSWCQFRECGARFYFFVWLLETCFHLLSLSVLKNSSALTVRTSFTLHLDVLLCKPEVHFALHWLTKLRFSSTGWDFVNLYDRLHNQTIFQTYIRRYHTII